MPDVSPNDSVQVRTCALNFFLGQRWSSDKRNDLPMCDPRSGKLPERRGNHRSIRGSWSAWSVTRASPKYPVVGMSDIVLLDAEWPSRALLRAQLIEDGFDGLATDTWMKMRHYLRPGSKPQLAIVDLQGLPQPEQVLEDLKVLMPPRRVLVLSALGTVADEVLARWGFSHVKRPIFLFEVDVTPPAPSPHGERRRSTQRPNRRLLDGATRGRGRLSMPTRS
jgi:hypothetical protein